MVRKEFLSMVGQGASLLFLRRLGGCTKDEGTAETTAPTNVDFTIDLT